MRVLLTDGSGLTARQVATLLARGGHTVEVLTPDPVCLCRWTGHVRRLHRVPAYGADPLAWLDAALTEYEAGGFDVMFPTQEQVAVMSACAPRLAAAGVATAVPPFDALRAVQDKAAAAATLSRLGLPQPQTTVLDGPLYVKAAIGTASAGVARLAGPVVAQAEARGPLAMCQSVWDHGHLVAFHTNLRVRAGARGGASHKRSVDLPEVRGAMATLGRELDWHGALSADVILSRDGPLFIDLNPRLVEPANAGRAGVDLVGALIAVARGSGVEPQPTGRSGVRTHQLLLAILGAAEEGGGRRGVAHEIADAVRRRGSYAASVEELTPASGDPIAVAPVIAAAVACVARPAAYRWFTAGSVAGYALSPEGWDRILKCLPSVSS